MAVREKHAYLKSLIALLLVLGCLWAGQWQYHRGVDRHQRNFLIQSHLDLPIQDLTSIADKPADHEWQRVVVQGEFNLDSQILLRNHYSEGVYGYELLTQFTSLAGKIFWVDCGWVKAGERATDVPELPKFPSGFIEIQGRLRLDTSLPRGSFFAIPATVGQGLIAKANAQSNTASEKYYLDLLSGSHAELTPAVAAQLPELSDGPHMAYAIQWLFFAALILYGRFLIRRDILSVKEIRVEPATGH